MKRIIIYLLIVIPVSVSAQRQLVDSLYFKIRNSYEYFTDQKHFYNRSIDNLIDTIVIYEYSKPGGYYYKNGGSINTFYNNGKLKSEAKWGSNSFIFDYKYANEDYEFEYTDFGELKKRTTLTYLNNVRSPFSISSYYYTNERLDSIVRNDFNRIINEWQLYDKEEYQYTEIGYNIITLKWIPELNVFVETMKTECQLENGNVMSEIHYIKDKQEWKHRFSINYEYRDDGYSCIELGSTKQEFFFDKYNNLYQENVFSWNSNLEYWSYNYTREFTYFYSNSQTRINDVYSTLNNIYASNGKLYIESLTNENIRVISIIGLVYSFQLIPGLNEFPIPKGIYIVAGKKIIVQ